MYFRFSSVFEKKIAYVQNQTNNNHMQIHLFMPQCVILTPVCFCISKNKNVFVHMYIYMYICGLFSPNTNHKQWSTINALTLLYQCFKLRKQINNNNDKQKKKNEIIFFKTSTHVCD